MSNRLLIGNLPLEASDSSIRDLFSRAGSVQSVELATDPQTGMKKGFAFVEMSSDAEAEKAANLLQGAEVGGRLLTINLSERARQRSSLSFIDRCVSMLQGPRDQSRS